LLDRALAIRQEVLGPADPKVAEVLERQGALDYNRAHFDLAEAKFRQALDIDRNALGERNIATAYAMGDLGAALRELHRYGEAQSLVVRSLSLRRELLPRNHLSIAGSLNNLGRIYLAERHYADAREVFEESLHIRQASVPPDQSGIGVDEALLERVSELEAGVHGLIIRMQRPGAAMMASLALLIGFNLWSERRLLADPMATPLASVQALALLAGLCLMASAGFLGAVGASWLILAAGASIVGDIDTLRPLGKLGGLVGAWLAVIVAQLLANVGRWAMGMPTRPVVFLRWGVRPAAQFGGGDAAGAQPPTLAGPAGGGRATVTWFAAMEYYALILNRTYKVFVTDRMLCGAYVRGLVSRPIGDPAQMFEQAFWVQTRSAQVYDNIDVTSPQFLAQSSANFQIEWSEIAAIEYRPGQKWGMGNLPHSGRIVLALKSGKSRELILLGYQEGEALARRLERAMKADVKAP
jgi:tetratricopeptide (TPR) repeat protein